MRRQVKPFVTEYRGSPRRSKDLHPSGDLQQEVQAPRSRFAEAEKMFHGDGQDNSYEAALRAADALFDASPSKAEPAQHKGSVGDPELRTSSQTSSASQAASAFRNPADDITREVFTEEDFGEASEQADRYAASAPRRILQAIEPPAEDRFAALEAERAPKRRGRKPGSKNKPKIVAGDDWAVPIERPAAVTVPALPAAPSRVIDAMSFFSEPDHDKTGAPLVVVDAVDGEPPLPRLRSRTEKFNWKREGLRPGERWKRRLPKAAR